MKKLFKSIAVYSLLIGPFYLLPSLVVVAATNRLQTSLVLVREVIGNAFYSYQGQTQSLRPHQQLVADTDLFIEEGSQVCFVDFNDRQYYLAGGSQLTISSDKMRLVRGILWIQSRQENKTFRVVTANGETQFRSGEGIFSFDNATGKTQLLVLRGEFSLANQQNKEQGVTVQDGEFSFVVDQQDGVIPRTPTSVGQKSFLKIVQLFTNVAPLTGTQSLAINTQYQSDIQERREESKLENHSRSPAGSIAPRQQTSLQQLYRDKLAALTNPKSEHYHPLYAMPNSTVKVTIFQSQRHSTSTWATPSASEEGREMTTARTAVTARENERRDRAPASLTSGAGSGTQRAEEFEASIMGQYKQQMRHSAEVNQLIDQLQSYQKDYQKSY